MTEFKSQFISKKQFENAINTMKRSEIYKAFNLDKKNWEKEIEYWRDRK